MDNRTGNLLPESEVHLLHPPERLHYIPVKRDLTAKEKFDRQIKLYSPCGCGSGVKFKFCCKVKPYTSIKKTIITGCDIP